MKVFIYGSCVSRDIFRELCKDEYVVGYIARSSLISRMASPLSQNDIPDLTIVKSKWQRRQILHDFLKSDLFPQHADAILVDFIDERFNILEYKETYITESKEIKSTYRNNDSKYKMPFSRGSDKDYQH